MAFQLNKRKASCKELQKKKERLYYEEVEGPQYRCIAFTVCVFGVIGYSLLAIYVIYLVFFRNEVT